MTKEITATKIAIFRKKEIRKTIYKTLVGESWRECGWQGAKGFGNQKW